MQMERACTIAVYVHVYIIIICTCYNAAQRSMHICMGEVLLWDIESRVRGAGGVQGELLMLRVYVEL